MSKALILDRLEEIKRVDKSNMVSFCVEAPKHYEKASKLADNVSIDYPKPKNLIVAGMGGSAISGELLKDWAREQIKVPIEVCREYSLPAYANKQTLVFILSYSGETEESLSCFLNAIKRRCMVICISSGGALLKFAEKFSVPYLRIPSGIPPRAALPYLFMPMPIFLEKLGLVANLEGEISEAIRVLEDVCAENSPLKPFDSNFSKNLAFNILGTIPVVYGFGIFRSVAQRFKQQFNENSKIPSKWESFPELNHNEVVGWEEAKEFVRNFSLIFIRSEDEPEEIRHRIEATKELISESRIKIFEVWSVGKSRMAKMLSTICAGDFTSVYLAVLKGVDPTPVKTIVLLKEKMGRSGVKQKIMRELEELSVR